MLWLSTSCIDFYLPKIICMDSRLVVGVERNETERIHEKQNKSDCESGAASCRWGEEMWRFEMQQGRRERWKTTHKKQLQIKFGTGMIAARSSIVRVVWWREFAKNECARGAVLMNKQTQKRLQSTQDTRLCAKINEFQLNLVYLMGNESSKRARGEGSVCSVWSKR